MQEEFEKFLECPTAENYLAVRRVVKRHATYSALALELVDLERRLERRQYRAVLQRVDELLPGCSLSPRLHFQAARAARELTDLELFELEKFMFQACMQGLLATGDGSKRRPYVVTYLTDVRDILEALDADGCTQQSRQSRGQMFDVVTTTDGERLWFNVTGLLAVAPAVSPHVAAPLN